MQSASGGSWPRSDHWPMRECQAAIPAHQDLSPDQAGEVLVLSIHRRNINAEIMKIHYDVRTLSDAMHFKVCKFSLLIGAHADPCTCAAPLSAQGYSPNALDFTFPHTPPLFVRHMASMIFFCSLGSTTIGSSSTCNLPYSHVHE